MITELSAQNFKSWEDTGKLQFAPLTGFFGANSSGKSSILQILLMLKQTTEQSLESNEPLYFGDEDSIVDLRSFGDIIHRPIGGPSLGISVSWRLPKEVTILNDPELDTISFYFNFYNRSVGSFNYQVGEHEFGVEPEAGRYVFKASTHPNRSEWVNLFRCYGVRGISTTTQKVFNDLEAAFEDSFSRIYYLGPRREDPRREYPWKQSYPMDVGRYGEKTISALLSSSVQQRSTYYQVMEWLRKLELINSYTLNSISDTEHAYEFLVKQYKDGPEVGLTDVGFGVSQILPVLTQCYCVPEGSTLILEQPEAHLHPKAQSELADVLIDVVKNRNIQIILESHSEHLLLRLMRRIAEEEISADQTAFHFCKIEDGNSQAEQLKVDEYGNISNWPKDFFGDEMGDLAEKTKAEMKRRKANK